MKRSGFTLIEVLVASLLLSMLVMILTMVFNQSSIAWRTGKASVAKMDKVRRRLSNIQKQADDLVPDVTAAGGTYARVVSAWEDGTAGSSLRHRAVERMDSTELPTTLDHPWQKSNNMTDDGLGTVDNYVVGVWSYGKNGKPNDEDDITTWPDKVK